MRIVPSMTTKLRKWGCVVARPPAALPPPTTQAIGASNRPGALPSSQRLRFAQRLIWTHSDLHEITDCLVVILTLDMIRTALDFLTKADRKKLKQKLKGTPPLLVICLSVCLLSMDCFWIWRTCRGNFMDVSNFRVFNSNIYNVLNGSFSKQ